MKTIYIILTRSTTLLSRIVYLVTLDPYTHASIAFDGRLQTVYSSSRKNGRTVFPAGPCRENYLSGYYGKHPHIPCAVYRLQVSDQVYESATGEVARIMAESGRYHFNIVGLLLCRIQVRSRRKHHFFCSQFVGEILLRSNALSLPKDSSLMRPRDYMDVPELRCCYRGNIGELIRLVRKDPAGFPFESRALR